MNLAVRAVAAMPTPAIIKLVITVDRNWCQIPDNNRLEKVFVKIRNGKVKEKVLDKHVLSLVTRRPFCDDAIVGGAS